MLQIGDEPEDQQIFRVACAIRVAINLQDQEGETVHEGVSGESSLGIAGAWSFFFARLTLTRSFLCWSPIQQGR